MKRKQELPDRMASRSYGKVTYSLIVFGWSLTGVIYTVVETPFESYVDTTFRHPKCWWARQRDSTLRCKLVGGEQQLVYLTYLDAQKAVEPDSGLCPNESAFLQDQLQKERQPQNAWMRSIRNEYQTRREGRSTSAFGPPFDHGGGFVHAQTYRPSSSVIVRHAHCECASLWLHKQWHFLSVI